MIAQSVAASPRQEGLPVSGPAAYLAHMFPAGFIAPCLPTKTDRLPSGGRWLHEIKHDGFRVTGSAFLPARSGVRRGPAILTGAPKAERKAAPKHIINVSYPSLCSIEQHI